VTDTATIKGREVQIRKLNETQIMLMVREAQTVSSERSDLDRRLRGISTMFNILESIIIDDEDRLWLIDLAAKGDLQLRDLMSAAYPEADKVIEGTVQAKPVRRGRPVRK
jgi:hypothetical protein